MPRLTFALALLLAAAPWAARAASAPAVEAAGGMVVTSQRLASEAGAGILRQGGNAIDAAVAVGYALAVVNPCCGNVGGGGFMTLHLAATPTAPARQRFLNFRETAPAAATATMYLDAQGTPIPENSLYGSRAAGVPGTVMGLETARATYGTLPRATLLAPAIALARDGFVLTRADTDILAPLTARFARQPERRPHLPPPRRHRLPARRPPRPAGPRPHTRGHRPGAVRTASTRAASRRPSPGSRARMAAC